MVGLRSTVEFPMPSWPASEFLAFPLFFLPRIFLPYGLFLSFIGAIVAEDIGHDDNLRAEQEECCHTE